MRLPPSVQARVFWSTLPVFPMRSSIIEMDHPATVTRSVRGLQKLHFGVLFAALSSLLTATFISADSYAQDAIDLPLATAPIPEDPYESWSLFLICNPAWVLPSRGADILDLYAQFRYFGESIGPRHVAVWFWNTPDIERPHEDIDFVRSAAWCELLELSVSDAPYVIITTDFPGPSLTAEYPDGFRKPDNYAVLTLSGLGAQETLELLDEFIERIEEERIFELDVDSEEDFWQAWQRMFESARASVLGAAGRVTVSINTQIVNVEIDLSSD